MRDPARKVVPFQSRGGWSAVAGLRDIVERDWEDRRALLQQRVEGAVEGLKGMVVLEEHRGRSDADAGAYAASLGGFASKTVDPRSLYALAGRGRRGRANDSDRPQRLRALIADLEKHLLEIRENPPLCLFVESDCGAEEAISKARDHVKRHAAVLRLLNSAAREERGMPPRGAQDLAATASGWSHREGLETGLMPPCLILRKPLSRVSGIAADLLPIVSSGLPVKLVVAREGFPGEGVDAHPTVLGPLEPALETLVVSLRRVFFLQAAHTADTGIEKTLARALAAPYPAVISVLAGGGGGEEQERRLREAVRSRAFPTVIYDPARRKALGGGLDLSHNPDPEREWPPRSPPSPAAGEGGAPGGGDFTFADFAHGEPYLRHHFLPLPEGRGQDDLVPVAEFLRLSPALRRGKTPFVRLPGDEEGGPERAVPSPYLTALTEERLECWLALREAAGGAASPPARKTAETAGPAPEAGRPTPAAALEEARLRERERAAVNEAMGKLVRRLAAMASEGMDLQGVLNKVSADGGPAAASTPPEISGAEQPPRIETEECTTCDECLNINASIFAYNEDRKAFIKNPRGGPYRDIVKAAEKCQAAIIRPGKPLNPTQADLDKWVRRAEPFN